MPNWLIPHEVWEEGKDERWSALLPPPVLCGLSTHVNARGVKGALVGDAGVANRVREAAVSQEAPSPMDDGSDDRYGESDG